MYRSLVSAFFLIVCCAACSSTKAMRLEPQAAPWQQGALNKDQLIIVSQQFNSVTLSPHTLTADPGQSLRFYIEIRNGSALEVPFRAKNVSAFLNDTRLTLLGPDAIRERILRARDEAVKQQREEQKRIIYGDPGAIEDLDDKGLDWQPGNSLSDVHAMQRRADERIQSIDARTRAQLTKISQHSLHDQTLKPGQTYDTYIEVVPPSTLKPGDILSVRIGLEPDVHEFRFVTAKS